MSIKTIEHRIIWEDGKELIFYLNAKYTLKVKNFSYKGELILNPYFHEDREGFDCYFRLKNLTSGEGYVNISRCHVLMLKKDIEVPNFLKIVEL